MTTLPCFLSRTGAIWRCTHCKLTFRASHLPPLEESLAACPHNPHARGAEPAEQASTAPESSSGADGKPQASAEQAGRDFDTAMRECFAEAGGSIVTVQCHRDVLAEARQVLIDHVCKLPLNKRDHGPVLYRIDELLAGRDPYAAERRSVATSTAPVSGAGSDGDTTP